jgi:hypothetical protein
MDSEVYIQKLTFGHTYRRTPMKSIVGDFSSEICNNGIRTVMLAHQHSRLNPTACRKWHLCWGPDIVHVNPEKNRE